MLGTHRFVAVLAALLLLAGTAFGQVKSSAIAGTVTDASGASVPGADVVVANEETNIQVAVKSNQAGEYMVPYLAAGQYSVTIKAQGFRTFKKTGIVMGTGTTMRVDASLATGSLETTIEVKADALALQTESGTVQAAVSQDIIQNIPNINNNPLYYATLQAGVVPSLQMYNGNILGVGYADRMQMSDMRINGGLVGTNDVQLDGISVQGAAWHETAVMPNRDTIQEVRVVANSFSADLGHGQGLISMITKSGTNQFHGSANYRLRNEALNANGLYNNMYGIPRRAYRVNEYGGTIGGPVIIPKLFNGKDKLFFFASYERLTHSDSMNYLGRVPTELERNGDFSQTMVADNNGNPTPVKVFDPFTAAPYQGSSQVFVRQPYPNSVITNADPYGLKILQAYPLPNHTPSDAFQRNNYAFNSTVPTVRNNLATRLDYHLSDRQSLYLSGGLQNGSVAAVNAWGNNKYGFYNNANGQSTPKSDDNPYAMVGDTITLSPTTILDVRYGVTRVHAISGFPVVTGINLSDWGMPSGVQTAVTIPGTAPSIGNFCGSGTNCNLSSLNFDGWNRKNEHQTNHSLAGSVTKVLGKWTLKQGAEYRVYLGNYQDLQYATPSLGLWSSWNSTGQFGDINGSNLDQFNTSPALRGIDMAGPLAGAGGYSVAPGTGALAALAAKYLAFYSQNDWKVTPKLTLNLGLRYEIQPGPTERHNRNSSLDISQPIPYVAGLTLPGSPLAGMGKRVFGGLDGYSRNIWDTQWNNISPRIGFAYRVGNSLVLRAGYGRTFTPSNTGFNANSFSYGMAAFANGTNPRPYGLTPNGVPAGRFEDPQNTQVIVAQGAVQDPTLYGNVYNNTGADSFRKHGFKNGQVDQWNFFIERTIGRDWLASVGYVGSHASNLPWRWFPLNGWFNVPDSTLQGWRDQWVASNGTFDPGTVQVPNPIPALIGKATGSSGSGTINAWQLGLPYQAFLGESYVGTLSTLNYNALEAKLQHAYSNGLTMMLNYTWSKSLGLAGGPSNSNYAESQINGGVGPAVEAPTGGNDYRNLQNNYGLMSYDTPQRFVGVVSYLLPTGKGQKLDPGNRFARALVGEWQFGTVVTLQSGQPWGNDCGSAMNHRCNIASGESLELPKSLQRWYDGKTSVTLPNGRTITPAAHTFLKWNPDYWTVPMVQFPDGRYAADQYQWLSTAHYLDALRTPGLANVNLTVNRKFHLKERAEIEFLAEATNAFNRTNFIPSAVNGGYSAVTVADPSTNTKPGQNASIGAGSLVLNSPGNVLQPRQITLSLRLQF